MRTFFATLILLIGGQIFFWGGISSSYKGVKARSWPTVEGEIRTAKMMQTRRRKGGTSYHPALRYVYELDGRRYNGERIRFGDPGGGSMDKAMKSLVRYAPETKVTVHYHPKDPETAVLETGTTSGNMLRITIGAVLSAIGGWIGFSAYRRLTTGPIDPGTGF